MKGNRVLFAIFLSLLMVVAAGCGAANNNTANNNTQNNTSGNEGSDEEVAEVELSGELVIYSSRKEEFVKPILDKFEEETGVKVKLLAGDEGIVNKMVEEKANPQADIFFSNDTGAMEYLRLEGILQANDDEALEVIDEKYRAEDGSWVGLSARTRGLIYNKDLITEEEMPKTLKELADPKWNGEFAITRGGNGSMIAHVAALRTEWGDEETEKWLKDIAGNAGAVTKGHGDIRQAVGAGEFKFGLVNNYYYHQQLNEPSDNNVGFIYPDQDGMGAFVNAAGIGLIEGSKNVDNAKAFIRYMLEMENLKEFAYNSKEVPLHPEVEAVPEATPISEYKVMEMPLREIGPVWNDAKQLIEKAGLPLETQ